MHSGDIAASSVVYRHGEIAANVNIQEGRQVSPRFDLPRKARERSYRSFDGSGRGPADPERDRQGHHGCSEK